jgi:hypothetical protein
MNPQTGRNLTLAALAVVLWALNLTCVVAGTNTNASSNASSNSPAYFRLSQLGEAKAKAKAEGKAIVWIASFPGSMTPYKNLLGPGSHAATYHAYLTFYRDAVVVWSDSDSENHREPAIVDGELHSPDAHYTAPGVIALGPDLDKVIGKVFHISDGKARAAAYAELLKKVRDKASWGGAQAPKASK